MGRSGGTWPGVVGCVVGGGWLAGCRSVFRVRGLASYHVREVYVL